jgi:hypothetical protein
MAHSIWNTMSANETFDDLLKTIGAAEDARQTEEYVVLLQKYRDWASLLQSVNEQFMAAAAVFKDIEEQTHRRWRVSPTTYLSGRSSF